MARYIPMTRPEQEQISDFLRGFNSLIATGLATPLETELVKTALRLNLEMLHWKNKWMETEVTRLEAEVARLRGDS